MSVEYALLLVMITGAVIGVLSLDVTRLFETGKCALEAALSGGSCAGGTVVTPAPTTSEPGPGPTGAPTTSTPIPADSTPSCDATSSQTEAPQIPGSNPSAPDCTTTTSSD